jgi:hypothetical protein
MSDHGMQFYEQSVQWSRGMSLRKCLNTCNSYCFLQYSTIQYNTIQYKKYDIFSSLNLLIIGNLWRAVRGLRMIKRVIARSPSQNFSPIPLRHAHCVHMDNKVQPLVLHTMVHSSIVCSEYPDSISVWKNGIRSFTSPTTIVTVELFTYKHIDTNTVNLTYYLLRLRTAPICDNIHFCCSDMMGVSTLQLFKFY